MSPSPAPHADHAGSVARVRIDRRRRAGREGRSDPGSDGFGAGGQDGDRCHRPGWPVRNTHAGARAPICSEPTSPATWAHADRSSKSGRAHARRRPSLCATRVAWLFPQSRRRRPTCPCSRRAWVAPRNPQAPAGRRSGPCSRLRPLPSGSPAEDDHSETAWRLRHLRRGILKDITVPPALLADADAPETAAFGAMRRQVCRGRPPASPPTSSPAYRLPANSICLTTGSFDSPKELFSARQFLAQHRVCLARGACRRPGGLVDARRAHPGRYFVLVRGRGIRDARARPVTASISACRTARSDTMAAIPRRCATSRTEAATWARSMGSTRSPSRPPWR